MNDAFQAITESLRWLGTAGTASQVILALTLAGTVSTAVLQLCKDLTAIRRVFQRCWLGAWLTKRVTDFNQSRSKDATLPEVDLAKVKAELIDLATGGDTNAFYDLPSDQLVAQANAAAQAALDYPGKQYYYPLLAAFSQGADLADFKLLVGLESVRKAAATAPLSPDATDARTRVAHRLQRNLDGMQISLGDKWQFFLQSASFVTSTVVIEIAVYASPTEKPHPPAAYLLAIGVGLVASYLSPVINDLIKGLQSLRK